MLIAQHMLFGVIWVIPEGTQVGGKEGEKEGDRDTGGRGWRKRERERDFRIMPAVLAASRRGQDDRDGKGTALSLSLTLCMLHTYT